MSIKITDNQLIKYIKGRDVDAPDFNTNFEIVRVAINELHDGQLANKLQNVSATVDAYADLPNLTTTALPVGTRYIVKQDENTGKEYTTYVVTDKNTWQLDSVGVPLATINNDGLISKTLFDKVTKQYSKSDIDTIKSNLEQDITSSVNRIVSLEALPNEITSIRGILNQKQDQAMPHDSRFNSENVGSRIIELAEKVDLIEQADFIIAEDEDESGDFVNDGNGIITIPQASLMGDIKENDIVKYVLFEVADKTKTIHKTAKVASTEGTGDRVWISNGDVKIKESGAPNGKYGLLFMAMDFTTIVRNIQPAGTILSQADRDKVDNLPNNTNAELQAKQKNIGLDLIRNSNTGKDDVYKVDGMFSSKDVSGDRQVATEPDHLVDRQFVDSQMQLVKNDIDIVEEDLDKLTEKVNANTSDVNDLAAQVQNIENTWTGSQGFSGTNPAQPEIDLKTITGDKGAFTFGATDKLLVKFKVDGTTYSEEELARVGSHSDFHIVGRNLEGGATTDVTFTLALLSNGILKMSNFHSSGTTNVNQYMLRMVLVEQNNKATAVIDAYTKAESNTELNKKANKDLSNTELKTSGKVAIGSGAGQSSQSGYAVAIGEDAGNTGQGGASVAIGKEAGNSNQGEFSVAIGYQAGLDDQATESIVINANGTVPANLTESNTILMVAGSTKVKANSSGIYLNDKAVGGVPAGWVEQELIKWRAGQIFMFNVEKIGTEFEDPRQFRKHIIKEGYTILGGTAENETTGTVGELPIKTILELYGTQRQPSNGYNGTSAINLTTGGEISGNGVGVGKGGDWQSVRLRGEGLNINHSHQNLAAGIKILKVVYIALSTETTTVLTKAPKAHGVFP